MADSTKVFANPLPDILEGVDMQEEADESPGALPARGAGGRRASVAMEVEVPTERKRGKGIASAMTKKMGEAVDKAGAGVKAAAEMVMDAGSPAAEVGQVKNLRKYLDLNGARASHLRASAASRPADR